MEFYFEPWEVGMFKKSQGKLIPDVCSNQDISHLTDCFFFFTDI